MCEVCEVCEVCDICEVSECVLVLLMMYEIEAASILRRWETPSNHFHPMLKGVGVCHPPCRDDHAPVSLVVWRLSGSVRLYGRTGHGSIRS